METSAGAAIALPMGSLMAAKAEESPPPYQATGVKAGEITDHSAIIWARLTAKPVRNNEGVVIPGRVGKAGPQKVATPVDQIEGACPGAPGRIRLRYGAKEDLSDAVTTNWFEVTEATDYAHHFAITGLKADTRYFYTTETAGKEGAPKHGTVRGQFETAPTASTPSDFSFCVMTCQGYPDRDHAEGHNIYPSMLALKPKFVCFTGDVVYYDNDEPRAINVSLARLHWERMFSLPRQMELLKNTGSYWLKDDHDTLNNDAWPGKKMGLLSFAEGQRIFREQTPMSEKGYRTFRWGRDVQVWLTDGRDFRSSNTMPDGPDKTIWGTEQKEWFKRTIQESDATWKILVSPTPLVGPDRKNKNDNHANEGFACEGDEIRRWLQANVPQNFFVLCGDRHWQYHSVHPETGVQEFSVGAASDAHAGGTPGEDKTYHRFHRVKGGFLSVTVKRNGNQSRLKLEHRDVLGAVVNTASFQRAAI